MKSSEFNNLSKEEKKKLTFKDLPMANKIAMGAFFSVAIFLTAFMFIFPNEKDNTPHKQDLTADAIIVSQGFVKSVLKSPSTADFPFLDHNTQDLGDNRYQVISYVDSQNGFGAMIRSNYVVTMKYKGGSSSNPNNWILEDIKVQ